jgi:hypothetical protein
MKNNNLYFDNTTEHTNTFSRDRIIIIIHSTALEGPWPPQANVASNLYPGHLLGNLYNPVSMRLPLPRQSILISVGHVLVDYQSLSKISF